MPARITAIFSPDCMLPVLELVPNELPIEEPLVTPKDDPEPPERLDTPAAEDPALYVLPDEDWKLPEELPVVVVPVTW